jgi:hypothetical protein
VTGDPRPPRDITGQGHQERAALGLVHVGDDFEREYPDRSIEATLGVSEAAATALAVIDGADVPLTPSQISERVLVASQQ